MLRKGKWERGRDLDYTNTTRSLEVETLGCALLLAVEDIVLGLLKVLRRDLHAALAQRHQSGLRTDRLNVGAAEVVLCEDQVVKVDVLCQGHLRGVNVEDAPLRLLIRQRKLNLAVNATGANEGGVERLNAVRRHDHLDVAARVKAVQLVQQLQHGALNFALAARVGVIAKVR